MKWRKGTTLEDKIDFIASKLVKLEDEYEIIVRAYFYSLNEQQQIDFIDSIVEQRICPFILNNDLSNDDYIKMGYPLGLCVKTVKDSYDRIKAKYDPLAK